MVRCVVGFVVGGKADGSLVFPLGVEGRSRDQVRQGLTPGASVYLYVPLERIRPSLEEGDRLLIEQVEAVEEIPGRLADSRVFVQKEVGHDRDGDPYERYYVWRVVEEGAPPLVECLCRTDWDGRWVALAMVALQTSDLATAKATVSFASDRSREQVRDATEPLRKELEAAKRRAGEAENLIFEIIASRLSPPEVGVLRGEGYRFSEYLKSRQG